MATLKIKLPDDLMIGLERLGNQADAVIEKTLEAGAEIIEDKARSNLKNVIGSGTKTESKSTGQLLNALGTSPVKKSNDGYDIKIGFSEPRKDGASNALIASVIEHGKRGQAAKPFMKPAEDTTKAKARAKMKKVFTEEAQRIVK